MDGPEQTLAFLFFCANIPLVHLRNALTSTHEYGGQLITRTMSGPVTYDSHAHQFQIKALTESSVGYVNTTCDITSDKPALVSYMPKSTSFSCLPFICQF